MNTIPNPMGASISSGVSITLKNLTFNSILGTKTPVNLLKVAIRVYFGYFQHSIDYYKNIYILVRTL
jgi:hypothetical protein